MDKLRADRLPQDVREDYPFDGKLFEQPEAQPSGGKVQMHYLDEGSGPVVLMLHGNPTWSFYYRNLIQVLTAVGFRCIVPDHIGCGLSDKPQEYPYTLERRIEDVERLIDHLGIQNFSLVVHDWGGPIGFGLAGKRPQALNTAVILNTAAFRSKRIPLRIAALKVPIIGEFLIRCLNAFAKPATWMVVKKAPLSKSARKGYLWPYRSWQNQVAIWNFVKDIPLFKSHRSYAQLKEVEANLSKLESIPIQIIWGAKDFCFNKHFFRHWCKVFPKAKKSIEDECGHYILEDGGEETLNKIKLFFTETDS